MSARRTAPRPLYSPTLPGLPRGRDMLPARCALPWIRGHSSSVPPSQNTCVLDPRRGSKRGGRRGWRGGRFLRALAARQKPTAAANCRLGTRPRNFATEMGDAVAVFSTDVRVPLEPVVGASGPAAIVPTTFPAAMEETAQKFGNEAALRHKKKDASAWTTVTWAEYLATTKTVAKALIKLGVAPSDGVSILGFNHPCWMYANGGAIFSGAISAGIYTTNGTEASKYIVEHSESSAVFVENAAQLKKFDSVRGELPKVRGYICWDPEFQSQPDRQTYSWADFVAMADGVSDEQLKERLDALKPGHCAALIYTSGTTGNPKAVMISHDNITWTARAAIEAFGIKQDARIVSYLPLSHIAAQILDIHGSINAGYCVYFAWPDALRGSLATTLKDVRPTIFLGVPRVWEKMQEAIKTVGAKNTGLKKKIAEWAKAKGLAGGYAEQEGRSKPFGYGLANRLVFKKVRANLGLDQCKICATSAAPISKDTLDFFLSLGIALMEVFGMSECTGPQTMSYPDRYQTGSCGISLEGTEIRIVSPDQDGNGEIVFRGRNRFMGYFKNPDSTADTIDKEGYLHSGDVGKVDSKGFLRITGRIKELIITAGGENVAPVPIEDILKECIRIVSNAVVIGDRRKFLTALFTLKTTTDSATGFPTRMLAPAVVTALEAAGSSAKTTTQAMNDPKVLQLIQQGLDQANSRAVSNAQRIGKFTVLEDEFTLESELTPTLKLKRRVVAQKYEQIIDAMYVGGEEGLSSSTAPKTKAAPVAAEVAAAPAVATVPAVEAEAAKPDDAAAAAAAASESESDTGVHPQEQPSAVHQEPAASSSASLESPVSDQPSAEVAKVVEEGEKEEEQKQPSQKGSAAEREPETACVQQEHPSAVEEPAKADESAGQKADHVAGEEQPAVDAPSVASAGAE